MLEEFDKQISVWAESFARNYNRRKMVGTTVKGLFATVAAATVGQLVNAGQAFAATCTCDDGWTTGKPCGHWGFPCPHNTSLTDGCPSNCSVCKSTDSTHGCKGWCNYTSGHWVSCTGCGTSGKGYKLCWDCHCPPGACFQNGHHPCSCLSGCIGA